MSEKLKPKNIGKNIRPSSDHKLSDVKQTSLRKAGRNNAIRIESEIDDTYDITISCLNQWILAIVVLDTLLFKN